MAGLLACGSPPCVAFPVSQWPNDARLAAHSCGGSRSFEPDRPSLRSLLIPEGNHRGHNAGTGLRPSTANVIRSGAPIRPVFEGRSVSGTVLARDREVHSAASEDLHEARWNLHPFR